MLDTSVDFANTVHVTSLGCARNLVDSEVMMGFLLQAGYQITAEMEKADFLLINTCGFLEAARQEGFETIEQAFLTKKASAKVIVAGCMVNKSAQELRERFPEVHAFLSSGDIGKVVEAIQDKQNSVSAKSYLEWGEVPRRVSTPKHYAYLKIAEGCKKRCAFCIIPTIKGPLQSKSIEQVVKEFRILRSQGVFEIILIAQDLGDFGKDRREKGALATLLRTLLEEKGKFWLRLLYLYPDEIDDEILSLLQQDPRLCPYLDMPIQHIDNDVLRAMHRTTSEEQIRATLEKLKKAVPHVSLRTSLMVGFPGETEKQFAKLLAFVREGWFDHVGIFTFSEEKEAYAAKLTPKIDEKVKKERQEKLAKAQQKVSRKKLASWIGKRVPAIVEGYHRDSPYLFVARHEGQCPDIDGVIIINDGRNIDSLGTLYEVEITDATEYDLIGRVVQKVGTPCSKRLSLLST